MKNTVLLAPCFILSSLLSTPVDANDKLSYNYTQFALTHGAGERIGDRFGYNFDISLDWTEDFYIRFGYESQSATVWASSQKSDVEAKEYNFSVGYHGAMTRSTDFYAELGYLKQDAAKQIPLSTFGNDEDGFLARLGVRSRFSADWEWGLHAGYKNVDYSPYLDMARHETQDTSIKAELRYYFSPDWSIGLSAGDDYSGTTGQIDIRFDL